MTVMRTSAALALIVAAGPSVATPQVSPNPPSFTMTITVEEAVRLALEHNLGVRVARLDPAIGDLAVAQARGAWSPTLTTTLQGASTDSPNISFLSGAQGARTTDERLNTNVAVEQALPWGGRYSVGWDSSRSTTTNIFSNFSPQVRSSLALTYRQPLLRGLAIDAARQQLLVSEKDRDIADVALREAIAATSRAVRHAYWELASAMAALDVQHQSLELARESLRNTRARIEIGTIPPIDVVEAEAEVAQREEAVIVGEAQIASAEDALRTLVLDPAAAGFWTTRIEPAALPIFTPATIDVDTATGRALELRTDLQTARMRLDVSDVNVRYHRNQTLPDVSASLDYGLTGLGGTQFVRGEGFPGPIVGATERSFATVLGDLFTNEYPSWTASLHVSYAIGAAPQESALARARLEHTRQQTSLREAELVVTAQVREAARQVLTNQRRVETTGVSRQLAERRLQAEERKLAAGTTTAFFVFQAQRDLAQARTNEVRAILDYHRSLVDFETVQEAPLR